MFGFFKNRRRQKLLAQPLPAAWRAIIERNVAVYARLPARQRKRLEDAAQIIVAERPFVGCRGMQIDDEVKVTIAAQAAVLLLGEEGYYFERVPSVLVYPDLFVRRRSHDLAHPLEEDVELLGESWQRGSIVLSWPAVLAGGRGTKDGQNLVLHEFAHHLDGLDGEMGGTPPLPTLAAQRRWREVFDREFAQHCAAVTSGRPTLLDAYGATNAAEMFAVSTECFFARPSEMRERHADLYDCFRSFYKVDPADWAHAQRPGPAFRNETPADDEFDDPATPAELPPLATADAYFTRGHEYFAIGRYDLAAADFNQAVRLSPDDQEALVYRAESRFWLDDVETALADAERACRLDPRDKGALRVRGLCRIALEQDREGLADLASALDTPSDDTEGLFFRALAHARLDEPQQALQNLDRVIELDPDDAEAYDLRAECWEQLGNADAAARDRARAGELRLEEE